VNWFTILLILSAGLAKVMILGLPVHAGGLLVDYDTTMIENTSLSG
jgi:hypothetical protein